MVEPNPDLPPLGFRYEIHKTVTATDVHLWAGLTGKRLVSSSTSAFTQQKNGTRQAAPDAYLTGLIVDAAASIAAHIPLPGATLTGLAVQFIAPVPVGTTLAVVVTLSGWDATARLYTLDISATGPDGSMALIGKAELRPHISFLVAV